MINKFSYDKLPNYISEKFALLYNKKQSIIHFRIDLDKEIIIRNIKEMYSLDNSFYIKSNLYTIIFMDNETWDIIKHA